MSLSVALGSALSALQVTQKSLEVTSHNIANAQTAGYSRQVVHRESLSASGQAGGVEIASIARQTDQHLLRDIRSESAAHAGFAATARFLDLLGQSFGSLSTDTSIGAGLADLASKLESAALEPESPARMRELVDAAAAVARELNGTSDRIADLRRQADTELGASVGTVNAALADIANLNRKIAQDEAAGRSTSDLRDSRDRALDAVSEQLDVTYFERPGGEVVVYTRAGQTLVDSSAATLAYDAYGDVTVDGMPITDRIASGRMRALIDLRDSTLPKVGQELDNLAVAVRDTLNQVHNRGTAFPAPASLTGGRSFAAATDAVTLSDPVRIAVLDAAGVVESHLDLPAGTYTLAGLATAIDTGLGAAGGASLGAGNELSISATGPDRGISIVDLAGGSDATISHGGADHAGFSNFFGLNDLYRTPAVGTGTTEGAAAALRVRSDIVADPARVARGRLDDAPTLTDGASLGMAAGDNRTLMALAERFDRPLDFAAAGKMPATSLTLGEYASQIVGLAAGENAVASERRDYQESLVSGLRSKAGAVSGVNVDEEMAQLMVLQNAYAASARLISTTSEMMRTLTDIV